MRRIKEVKLVLIFGLFLLVTMLIMDYVDLGKSSGDETSLQIPISEIKSRTSDGRYRLKSDEENQYLDYSFEVSKKRPTKGE